MKRLDKAADYAYKAMLAFTMFGIVACVTLQIIARYALSSPLIWTDEYSRLCFCWATFMGAAVASREDSHLEVEFFYERFGKKTKKVLDVCNHLLVGGLSCSVLYYGAIKVFKEAGARSTATRTPVAVFTAALLIGFLGIAVYSFIAAIRYAKGENPRADYKEAIEE